MSGIDGYAAYARVAPGLIALVPLLALTALLVDETTWRILAPVLLVALSPALGEWARRKGKRIERELVGQWGGMPTTDLLRWRSHDTADVAARHAALTKVTDETLPDAVTEALDEAGADAVYARATRILIEHCREHRVVQSELRSYGFSRNCLGVRREAIAITVVTAAVAVPVALVCSSREVEAWIGVGLAALAASWWWTQVTADRVLESGREHAHALFRAAAAL